MERRAYDEDPANRIPLDYKLFTFYGVVKFILQVDRNVSPPVLSFFDGEFQPITDDRVFIPPSLNQPAGKHRVPQCAHQLIQLAQQLSLKLKATFVSVDCYASTDGGVLGELTHTPGGPWYQNMYIFSPEFDLELGRAWRAAYNALNLDIPDLTVPYVVELKGKKYRTIY
ncbi:ATP-grasp fold amidoligase family protein [Paenalcaligenes hominis]